MNLQEIVHGEMKQVVIPETAFNKLLRDYEINHTLKVCSGYVVLSADNFQAEFSYHSHNFSNGNVTIDFILNRIKPFYYSIGLQLIHKRYPYLEYWKDQDDNKMITCYLNRIPGIDSVFNDYASYIKDIDIRSVDYREGKIIIGLRTKLGGTEGDESCLN